ncbi:MAG TPA: hypothetical protein VGE72_20020 [Azospirillum sp.]
MIDCIINADRIRHPREAEPALFYSRFLSHGFQTPIMLHNVVNDDLDKENWKPSRIARIDSMKKLSLEKLHHVLDGTYFPNRHLDERTVLGPVASFAKSAVENKGNAAVIIDDNDINAADYDEIISRAKVPVVFAKQPDGQKTNSVVMFYEHGKERLADFDRMLEFAASAVFRNGFYLYASCLYDDGADPSAATLTARQEQDFEDFKKQKMQEIYKILEARHLHFQQAAMEIEAQIKPSKKFTIEQLYGHYLEDLERLRARIKELQDAPGYMDAVFMDRDKFNRMSKISLIHRARAIMLSRSSLSGLHLNAEDLKLYSKSIIIVP